MLLLAENLMALWTSYDGIERRVSLYHNGAVSPQVSLPSVVAGVLM